MRRTDQVVHAAKVTVSTAIMVPVVLIAVCLTIGVVASLITGIAAQGPLTATAIVALVIFDRIDRKRRAARAVPKNLAAPRKQCLTPAQEERLQRILAVGGKVHNTTFSEGVLTVELAGGWLHIGSDGREVGRERKSSPRD
jgi:hypothetical protein